MASKTLEARTERAAEFLHIAGKSLDKNASQISGVFVDRHPNWVLLLEGAVKEARENLVRASQALAELEDLAKKLKTKAASTSTRSE